MDVIRLLPDSVANQIAAGEVIQRPASCLKELVENSLDAGATRVHIIVRDAGRTLLQVIDNGRGMSDTDARMAFERHATSKIREAADLFTLRTMGFRGEALPSICAVSQVEMQTKTEQDELGTLLEISGSDVIRQEPVQCPVGTNIRVRNLFFNVPVRRKFLKTDQTEMRNLLTEFYHIALVYPKVQFTLTSQDEVLFDLTPGTEKQRIEDIFGKGGRQNYTSRFVEISSDTELVSIRGFVGKPEDAGKNPNQYFFVNGRYMRHPYFHKAVTTAYEGMLANGANPSYFIYFDISPEAIDVNIHPTKTEIKFADEQLIFPILLATIREALGKFNVTPSLDFDVSGRIEMPLADGKEMTRISNPVFPRNTTYNPFRQQHPDIPRDWEQLYSKDKTENAGLPKETTELFTDDLPAEGTPVQIMGRYILLPTREGVLFINQHRAHACLLYDTCLQRLADHQGARQQLLFPEIWDLQQDDIPLVEGMTDELKSLGFDLERLTPCSYSLSAVPAILQHSNGLAALQDILCSVRETGLAARSGWQEKIALSMAYSAAIPYGKQLTDKEMADLVHRLFERKTYRTAPDGKVVTALLTNEQINKLF
jgi:DNA mismatch repair protein MutL